MKLFSNSLDILILKIDGVWKCTTLCPWCDEGFEKSSKGYDFEGLKKTILYSLEHLVESNTRFFIYGKNVFRLDYLDKILAFVQEHPHINIDFHLTTDMTTEEIEKLRALAAIPNLYFTFCQSYKTINVDTLNTIVEILGKKMQRSEIVIIAEKDYEKVETYLESIRNKGNFVLTLSKYPSFLWKKVTGTGIEKCVVESQFHIKENQLVLGKGVLLEILPDGDVRLHNYLCNLAGINITNIYKTYEASLKDFKRFIYFYHLFHQKGTLESNCYTCIKKIHYNYKRFDEPHTK